jgi:chromosome segregation ATPase
VYVQFKRALEDAEIEIQELEQRVARARYEYAIAQRIHARTTGKKARKDWESQVSAAHDMMVTEEHDLAEKTERADYCRAMLAEIEADLGDKARQYEEILDAIEWADEDWEEFEDWDEFDEWDEFGDWDEEDEWEGEEGEPSQPGAEALQ